MKNILLPMQKLFYLFTLFLILLVTATSFINCHEVKVLNNDLSVPLEEKNPSYQWKLDSIITWKFNLKKEEYELKGKQCFKYDIANKKDTLNIDLSGFIPELNKFNTLNEARHNIVKNNIELSENAPVNKWTKEKGLISFELNDEFIKSHKSFKWNKEKNKWMLHRFEKDSFNINGYLVSKYLSYTNSDGVFVENLTQNKYQDTLKTEHLIQSKSKQTDNQWKNGTRILYQYNESGQPVEETLYTGSGENFVWRSIRKKEWKWNESIEKMTEAKFSNFTQNEEWKVEELITYEWNRSAYVETYFKQIFDQKELKKEWSKKHTLNKEGKPIKIFQNNFDNGGYDEVLYTYEYNDKGKLIMEFHQNKMKENKDWRFVRKKIYEYAHPVENKYTSEKIYWSPDNTGESTEYIMDDSGNIISIAKAKNGQQKSSIDYIYDVNISKESVLVPSNLDYTVSSPNGRWSINHAIKTREMKLNIDGQMIGRRKVEYFYSPINE